MAEAVAEERCSSLGSRKQSGEKTSERKGLGTGHCPSVLIAGPTPSWEFPSLSSHCLLMISPSSDQTEFHPRLCQGFLFKPQQCPPLVIPAKARSQTRPTPKFLGLGPSRSLGDTGTLPGSTVSTGRVPDWRPGEHECILRTPAQCPLVLPRGHVIKPHR